MVDSPSLREYDWQSIYESQPSEDLSFLVNEFYVPALERSHRYDRIAGYFNSGSLATAVDGIEAFVENDGSMRLIVGAQLQPKDRPILEALADDLKDSLETVDHEELDARLQLLAWLLREHRLEIKIAVPKQGDWGIFHPKVGIFYDGDDVISFEGSINETASGWTQNYERFKVHRSWKDGQAEYVKGDQDSFRRLWNNNHEFVDVYELPEALRKEIIDWKAPDTDTDIHTVVEKLQGPEAPTDADRATILADGAQAPGGLQLAEEASTIDPWPHQRVVSDTAVNTYPNSFLLCDEVGLGKTIEVGLTLSRLGLTGELENSLVLAPASLVIQWQEELWEKFNINAYRYERGSNYDYVFTDVFGVNHPVPGASDLDIDADRRDEAWTTSPIWRFVHTQINETGPTVIVMSWHTARLTDRWDQLAPADDGMSRRRDDISASCRGRESVEREGVWDAVVVDEAHNARSGSNFYNFLDRLRAHTHCYYLLTATPMQLHHRELYDLLTLLDLPEEWDNRERFVDFFETRQALTSVLKGGIDLSGRETNRSQATLDGSFQDRFNKTPEYADLVLEGLVDELELEDEGRGIAKQRLLQACNLARSYGATYDGYRQKVDGKIDERIDPFSAHEDAKLHRLLYPESVLDTEMIISSRNDRFDALDELSEDGWDVLEDVFSWATPIEACIHRNTRDTLREYRRVGLLDENIPTRKPERRRIELNHETRQVYDRIDQYTQKFYKKAQQSSDSANRAIGFVMTTYRQRLTSSVYAISRSLASRLEKLRLQRDALQRRKRIRQSSDDDRQTALNALSDLDESELSEMEDPSDVLNIDLEELAPSLTDEGIGLLEEEIDELESFIQEVKAVDSDPKMDQLYEDLNMLDRQGRNRIIVFTQYKDTMHFVRQELQWKYAENIACYSGDGGEMYDEDADTWRNVGKERVKQEFADDDGNVDILVCTDSASEGLNLQECGALINYDLPWNPMRVEQRIGRIDRIGQRYDEVIILNYSYENTVESDIYDRLDDRIGLFEYVVGDMQPILSDVGSKIRQATMGSGVKAGTEEYADLEREIEGDIEAKQQDDSPIKLKDSLAKLDGDGARRDQVIREAQLDAWKTHSHPDLGDVGHREEAREPAYTVETIESIFVGNETLAALNVTLEPLSSFDKPLDSQSRIQTEAVYCLRFPADAGIEHHTEEGTLAGQIADHYNGVGVTFSPEIADQYPSLRYLAPGSPTLKWLIRRLQNNSESQALSTRAYEYNQTQSFAETDRQPWIVCGWTEADDSLLITLGNNGDIVESNEEYLTLQTWAKEFIENRLRASK